MKIAMVNNFFVPRPSGSVHLTEGLAKNLTARGHEVLVITAAHKDAPADEIRDGYRVARLPCWAPPKTRLSFNYDIPMTLGPRNLRGCSGSSTTSIPTCCTSTASSSTSRG